MNNNDRIDLLQKIDERLEDITQEMAYLADSRMCGTVGWIEYDKKRQALAKVRTALELEKKLLTEEYAD